jgi:hypothetical protein
MPMDTSEHLYAIFRAEWGIKENPFEEEVVAEERHTFSSAILLATESMRRTRSLKLM